MGTQIRRTKSVGGLSGGGDESSIAGTSKETETLGTETVHKTSAENRELMGVDEFAVASTS